MLRGTNAAFSLSIEHARHDTTDPHWARRCWMVMGQWHQPQGIPYMASVTKHLLPFGERVTKTWSMNIHCAYALSLEEVKITERESRNMDYRIGVIVSANNRIKHVTWIMCHVCGFICSLCVELKLKINTRSLFNQAVKSAHPSLLSSHCWPWGVFSSWLASRDLDTTRSSYLARVGSVYQTNPLL